MDQIADKGLTLRNKQVGHDEFISITELEGKTFDQIETQLWDRMSRINPVAGRGNLKNESPGLGRQTMRFEWQRTDGKMEPINGAASVIAFMHRTGVRLIFFWADTMGGSLDRAMTLRT